MTSTFEIRRQPIGDGPPRDEDSFHLDEDIEEPLRAAGGCHTLTCQPGTRGRWSFAEWWTGSWRYLPPPRQVEQAVPHKVKLLPFWEKDAAAWF